MKILLTGFIQIASIRKNLQNPFAKGKSGPAMTSIPPITVSPKKQTSSVSHSSATSTSLSYRTAMSSSRSELGSDSCNGKISSNVEDGTLLMMTLPKEWQAFNVNKDESNRIDPSMLSSALSAIEPTSTDTQYQNEKSNINFSFDTIIDISEFDPKDLIVSLDLDLCLKEENESIQIHMNRDAMEMADRTFKRLELSVAKKISSLQKKIQSKSKGQSKANQKRKRGKGANAAPTSRLFMRNCSGSTCTSRDNDDEVQVDNISTEEYSAVQLCKTLAMQHESEDYTAQSIALELSIPNAEEAIMVTNVGVPQISNCTTRNLELSVVSNPPTILSIQTFESFSSKLFPGVPVVIQTKLSHATRAEVSWFVDDKLICHNNHSFIPQPQHIGKSLSVIVKPHRNGYHGKCFREAYKFENVIEELPYMPIVSPLRDDFTSVDRSPEEKESTLRMMTYNILADLYVSREIEGGSVTYPHVKQEYVKKTRRLPMIITEILAHDPDVVCLQEVDGSVYDTYLQPAFQAMGYDGYYSNKASCQREGCTMFWSTDKFEVDEIFTFSLKDLFASDASYLDDLSLSPNVKSEFQRWDCMTGINQLMSTHEELRRVAMEKTGQVLQVARLKIKNPKDDQPEEFVVANTHLFYHPMADHIRLMQVYVVCKKVDEIRRNNKRSYPYPFVICGDLNSDPLSGAAQLLFTRLVQPDHHDCWKHLHEYQWDMGSSDYMVEHEYVGNKVGSSDFKYEEEKFKNAVEDINTLGKPAAPLIQLPESFPTLVSSFDGEMPEFTNYAVDFVDTLDYILGSQPSQNEAFGLTKKRSARMPSIEEVKQFVAMPNEFMPSDHVSVACDFRWCKQKEQ